MLVIDLDIRRGKNGIHEFTRLQGHPPEQFDAPRVVTGTGGQHIYADAVGRDFKNSRSEIALGIDTKTLGGYVIIPSGDGSYRWLTSPDTSIPPAPQWTEVALRTESYTDSDLVPPVKQRPYQGKSIYGDMQLSGAIEAIESAANGRQELILNGRSYVVGHYVGGGLLEFGPTVEALVAAGMRMPNFDKDEPWTLAEVREKVTRGVRHGMKHPSDDGTELDNIMHEVNRRYATDPKLQEELLELLTAIDAQRGADVKGDYVVEEPPEGMRQEQGSQDRGPAAETNGSDAPEAEEPWLKPGEQRLIRRMGQHLPPPVAFLVNGLLHEVGTGIMVAKYSGGKTFVAMSLAASVANGKQFADRVVVRRGAVLWLAAEGEREVDKRARAAVAALGCDPDMQPIYVQTASVPKLLSAGGEKAVMQIVKQAERAAMTEFGVPLVLVVIDTMIKSAGYQKTENDAIEVNNAIQTMENISIRTKCFVLAIDHMGKNESLGARGSSDKPSSTDVYIELKDRTFHAVKVKGEKGNRAIDFEIVGTTLEDGQNTACVRWGKWKHQEETGEQSLNGNARVMLDCARKVIDQQGQMRTLFFSEPPKRCVEKVEIYHAFCDRHEGKRHDMAFKRSWLELVEAGLITTKKNEKGFDDMNDFVYLERE